MGACDAVHPTRLPPELAEHPDFEIVRELDNGGMGTVYLALDRLMARHQVLKVVTNQAIAGREALDRFLGEIRTAAHLHHSDIVTPYSAMRIDEYIVFAMEYVDGLDLAKMVNARGPLPIPNACFFAFQVALGLQHANEQGIVHGDIKPSNVMLAKQGNRAVIKVLNFGPTQFKSDGAIDAGITRGGRMPGSSEFVAPERANDAIRADIRADIFSLGCTLYYLLTAEPSLKAIGRYEIMPAHRSLDALPLNVARPEVPDELAALVARMMAGTPERRFQSPAEVAEALSPFFRKPM
jgi:serine/threonine protein kinase